MSKRKSACFALASLTVSVTALAQDVIVPIDAREACLNTRTMTGGNTSFTISPGTYKATLEANSMNCGPVKKPWCKIDTAFIQILDNSGKKNSAAWGLAVRDPIAVVVHGSEDVQGFAFVADTNCDDNGGQATVHFRKVD